MRATKLPTACPVCRRELAAGTDLDEHLLTAHDRRDLASFVASTAEETEEEEE